MLFLVIGCLLTSHPKHNKIDTSAVIKVVFSSCTFALLVISCCEAFVASPTNTFHSGSTRGSGLVLGSSKVDDANEFLSSSTTTTTRRNSIQKMIGSLGIMGSSMVTIPAIATAADGDTKSLQEYDDFTKTDEGWSYREVTIGKGGAKAENGDRVVFDWSGYTIGYFGRPFQAKGGPKGGAFDKELDYDRTVIGSGKIVKGLECALRGMEPGGVRQVIVPYGPLSYPESDLEHIVVGPKPSSFSGQRALNFVLENPRVDRTLLFNVKVVRIDKPDGKGGFTRG